MKQRLLIWFPVLLIFGSGVSQGQTGDLLIYGQLGSSTGPETIELFLKDRYLDRYAPLPEPIQAELALEKGDMYNGAPRRRVFKDRILGLKGPTYMSLVHGNNILLDEYLVMPGDSISVFIDQRGIGILFAGSHATRYQCQYEMALARSGALFEAELIMVVPDKETVLADREKGPLIRATNKSFGKTVRLVDQGADELTWLREQFRKEWRESGENAVLERYRDKLDAMDFSILKANLIGRHYHGLLNTLHNHIIPYAAKTGDTSLVVQSERLFIEIEKELAVYIEKVDSDVACLAPFFLDMLYDLAKTRHRLHGIPVHEHYRENFTGELRDKLLAKYMVRHYERITDPLPVLAWAKDHVETDWVKKILEEMYLHQTDSEAVYGFELTDKSGNSVSLSDFRGTPLVISFWYTGCKVSEDFHTRVAAPVFDEFGKEANMKIISVSADLDSSLWLQSLASGMYAPADAVQLTTNGRRHPFLQALNVIGYPHYVFISSSGKIIKSGSMPVDKQKFREVIENLIKES